MAQRPPAATAGADLNADLDRAGLFTPLTTPPAPGLIPGCIQGVVKIVEHGVGSAVAVDQSEAPRLAGRGGPALGLGISQHGVPWNGLEILAICGISHRVLQHFFGSW